MPLEIRFFFNVLVSSNSLIKIIKFTIQDLKAEEKTESNENGVVNKGFDPDPEKKDEIEVCRFIISWHLYLFIFP